MVWYNVTTMYTRSISQTDKQKLFQIAKHGARIRTSLILESTALTPLNFLPEKEKFLNSRTYNPKFSYLNLLPNQFETEIDELEQQIENIENLPYDLMRHLIDYVNHLRFLYHARRSIGKPTFPCYAKLAFDWDIHDPDELLKKLPKFEFNNEHTGNMTNAEEIAKQLKKALVDKYKIHNIPVEVNDFTSNIIFVNSKQINIGKNIKRFQNNTNRLIVHEIESHTLQNYNMRNATNSLTALSKLSDSNLYSEGLGVFNEVKTNTITKSALTNYYYRLKAIKNSHLSFRQIYVMLLSDKLSKKQAFNITFRVKRGMHDTSKPGGYPKDAAYLLGYKAVLDFLRDNPEELMYYAKNPHTTKLLMKYNLIDKKPILIPDFSNPLQ